jgi:hypothetical protein
MEAAVTEKYQQYFWSYIRSHRSSYGRSRRIYINNIIEAI